MIFSGSEDSLFKIISNKILFKEKEKETFLFMYHFFICRFVLLEQILWKCMPFSAFILPTSNFELLFSLLLFSLQRKEGGMNSQELKIPAPSCLWKLHLWCQGSSASVERGWADTHPWFPGPLPPVGPGLTMARPPGFRKDRQILMSSQPLFTQGYILGCFSVRLPLLTLPQFRKETPIQPPQRC